MAVDWDIIIRLNDRVVIELEDGVRIKVAIDDSGKLIVHQRNPLWDESEEWYEE